MHVKTFLLLPFILLSLSTFCQDLYIPEKSELISEAHYKKYTKILKDAFKEDSKINMAVCYANLQADSSYVFSNLSEGLKADSSFTCEYVEAMNDIFNLQTFRRISSTAWEELCILCKDYNKRHLKVPPVPISDLEFKLDKIIKRDGEYRTLVRIYQKRNQLDSIDYYWRLQQINDSLNFIAMALIFDEYGYPGKSQVQEAFMDIGCIVMQHAQAPFDRKTKYVKLIHDAAIAQEFHRATYIHLIDHMHYDKFGTQLYRTQRYKSKEETEYRAMDLEDPAGFDKRISDLKNGIFHFGRLVELEGFKDL